MLTMDQCVEQVLMDFQKLHIQKNKLPDKKSYQENREKNYTMPGFKSDIEKRNIEILMHCILSLIHISNHMY